MIVRLRSLRRKGTGFRVHAERRVLDWRRDTFSIIKGGEGGKMGSDVHILGWLGGRRKGFCNLISKEIYLYITLFHIQKLIKEAASMSLEQKDS